MGAPLDLIPAEAGCTPSLLIVHVCDIHDVKQMWLFLFM